MTIAALVAVVGILPAYADTVLETRTGASPVASVVIRGGTPYRHLTAEAFSDAKQIDGKLQWRCGERNARGDFQIRTKLRGNVEVNPYSLVRRVPAFVRNSRRSDAYCSMRIYASDVDAILDTTVTISASRQSVRSGWPTSLPSSRRMV